MIQNLAAGTRTILVAEDDPDDRELIAAAFEAAGFGGSLRFVRDGRELLDLLEDEGEAEPPPPQLLLLDLNMPRVDGRSALHRLRALEHTRALPIIVLSTSSTEAEIAECYRRGANAYCTKPIDFAGLVSLARDISHWWFEVSKLPSPSA